MRLENFIGKATLAVDAAGRTNFPKEFRKILSEENEGQVVVTISGGGTLALFPLLEWNRYVQELEERKRGPERGPDLDKFISRLTSKAKLSVLDAQNRIMLTGEQMEYAGIRGEVTFAGAGSRVRLWAPDRYNAEIATVTPEEESRYSTWY